MKCFFRLPYPFAFPECKSEKKGTNLSFAVEADSDTYIENLV